MSHGKLRTEYNCLNCNAHINGRFCSVCGQENVEPKETSWQLTTHLIYDIFHYDGKFFITIKTLLFKPGILTYEYIRGKRASYLHPIRLYVFTAAVFFIIFISFIAKEKKEAENLHQFTSAQQGVVNKTIDQLNDTLSKVSNIIQKQKIQQEIAALKNLPSFFPSKENALLPLDAKLDSADIKAIDSSDDTFSGWKDIPKSLQEYKAQQVKLNANKKDGWFTRTITEKMISINAAYKYDKKGFIESLREHFIHLLPTMMFISLPLVALMFELLYIRRRKTFTYVQHGVFAIHVYCAVYIFTLLINVFALANTYSKFSLFGYLEALSIVLAFYYVYRAMKNFYHQSAIKTFLKLLIFSLSYFFVLLTLVVVFIFTSLIQV